MINKSLSNAWRAARGILLCTLLAPSLASAGKMQMLDNIAAVVNDTVIMSSELDRRVEDVLRNIRAENSQMPPVEIIRTQVLDRLIEEKLQLELANRMGLRIDDTSLNDALANIARQNNMTLEQFAEQIRSEGLQWAQFREQIRDDIVINQVRQRQVGQRVRVTDREIDRFLDSEQGKRLFESEFRLGHILIQIPDGATPDQIQSAEKEANDVVGKLKNGAEFSQMAISHSDDPYSLKGGDLGWRPAAQWPSLFSDKAIDMQAGDIAGPLRSGNGFHILKMIDRKGDVAKIVEQYHTRHILLKPSTIRSADASRELARSLHARISSGDSMEKLAREYSDDPGSARSGGELGWISAGEMVPEFEQQMMSTPIGQLSSVFETQYGWHFLRVDEKRSADMSDEFRRIKARNALQQRRYSEEVQTWLREIREEAYVDIRI
jgi:peptidyl-prolyl cis-trans isomerase SurA